MARWTQRIERDGKAGFAAIADAYLSVRHRDAPGEGCALPALAADAARRDPALRRVFTNGVRAMLGLLDRVAPGRTEARRRERAMVSLATMVGACVASGISGVTLKAGDVPQGIDQVAIDRATADRKDFEIGDPIDIVFDTGRRSFTIALLSFGRRQTMPFSSGIVKRRSIGSPSVPGGQNLSSTQMRIGVPRLWMIGLRTPGVPAGFFGFGSLPGSKM